MVKYSGGAYIHGVPARDLTEEEWKKYKSVIRKQEKIIGIKLYTEEKIELENILGETK